MKHPLIKQLFIVAGVVILTAGVATFAQTNIQTNIFNAVQTIMRTVYTDDGSQNGSRLMDINDGTGIYISGTLLQNTTAVNGLGIDANGYITTNVSLGVQSGEADHDWYEVGTTTHPDNINDNIYTYGQVGIGINQPTTSLQVKGTVIFGDNVFGQPNNQIINSQGSSILGGYENYIENISFGRNTIGGGGYNTIANAVTGSEIAYSFIGAGVSNKIIGNTNQSFIGAGNNNTITENEDGGLSDAAIVAGQGNHNSATAGFIGAGSDNILTGWHSSIVGGWKNKGDGKRLFIGGGIESEIIGLRSSIVGGQENKIQGDHSFIGGGVNNNITNADYSSILGGINNSISGWIFNNNILPLDIPLGYYDNGDGTSTLSATTNTIGGGNNNKIAKSMGATILGGGNNFIYGNIYSIIGGYNNSIYNLTTEGHHNVVFGGFNSLTGSYSNINGGYNNKIYGFNNNIGGGYSNAVSGNNNIIGGGINNVIENGGYNFIGGGIENIIYNGNGSSIVGGVNNKTTGSNNFILGAVNEIQGGNQNQVIGQRNTTTASNSTIIGFENNMRDGDRNFILGKNNTIEEVIQGIETTNSYILGSDSVVQGNESMTLGRNAHAYTTGRNLMVINLDSANAFTGYGNLSMLINAPRGVGINKNMVTPGIALDVNGNIKTQGVFVAPSNNQGITQTINLTDSLSNPCTLTVEAGIITATTCQ